MARIYLVTAAKGDPYQHWERADDYTIFLLYLFIETLLTKSK